MFYGYKYTNLFWDMQASLQKNRVKTDLNATRNVKNIKKAKFAHLFASCFCIFSVPLKSIGLKTFTKYILKYER